MNRKYELTDETKEVFGKTLHRIRALKAFGDVEAGELGGWIEREENLSQEGLCWVSDDGQVYGNGRVSGDAKVCGDMVIQRTRDYLTFGPAGSRNDITTFGSDANGSILVCCGCFYGTLEEFARKVEKTHGDNQFGKEYRAAIELARVRFLTEETK